MIRDITLGQFFPGTSVIHKADPRVKIVLVTAYIIFLFVTGNFVSLVFMVAVVLLGVIMTGIPVKMYFRGLKPVVMILIFTSVLNIFYGKGEAIWQWQFLKITWNGISNAAFVSIRIIALILISCILTYNSLTVYSYAP